MASPLPSPDARVLRAQEALRPLVAGEPTKPLHLLLESGRTRLFLARSLAQCAMDLARLEPRDHVVVASRWHVDEPACRKAVALLEALPGLDPARLLFLANTPAERDRLQRHLPRSTCLFVNNGCFLDERLFRPLARPKRFACVLNAGPGRYKRHHLSARLPGIARLFPHADRDGPRRDADLRRCVEENGLGWAWANLDRTLGAEEVVEILNQARVGLALSAIEGECKASSEYLLCGLPVVSTESLGGRDVWYTPENAILCEADPDAVADAVAEALGRLEAGRFQPDAIRGAHLVRAHRHRKVFTDALQDLFDREGVPLDAAAYFERIRAHAFHEGGIVHGAVLRNPA